MKRSVRQHPANNPEPSAREPAPEYDEAMPLAA